MDPEIQAELERLAGNSAAGADALARLNSSIQSGLPNWDAANQGLNVLGRQTQDTSKKTTLLGNAFDRIKKSTTQAANGLGSAFKSVANESENGAGVLAGFIQGVGQATAGLASVVPFLGPALGGIITAATGAAGAILGFVSGLTDVNKKMGSLGVFMTDLGKGGGIDGLDSAAQNAGITIGILSRAIENNIENLRLMSGGTSNAVVDITEAFKKLRFTFVRGEPVVSQTFKDLTFMGYSTQDMIEAMIDFGAAARMAGQDLDTSELAEGTKKYLTQQAELRRITGADIKTAKEKQRALQADFAFQAFMKRIADPDDVKQIDNFMGAMSNAPQAVQDLIKTILGGGQVTDANLKFLELQMGPGFSNELLAMRKIALDKDQKLTTEYMTGAMGTITSSTVKGLEGFQGSFTDEFIATAMTTNTKISEIFGAMGPTLLYFKQLQEQLDKGEKLPDIVSKQQGQIGKSLTAIESASISLQAMAYTMMASLAGIMGPITTSVAGTVDGFASSVQEKVSNLGEAIQKAQQFYMDPDLSEEEKTKKIQEALMQGATSAFGESSVFTSLFKELGNTIRDAILEGFGYAVAKQLPGVAHQGLLSDTTTIATIKSLETKLTELGVDLSKAANSDFEGKTPEEKELALMFRDLLVGATEESLKQTGYQKVDQGFIFNNLGVDKFEKIPAQAFGNIMEPKPGGHIVKVAEAGQPEVIAPASRGPNGKLGLEVSGAMLDNSRLLQSLLKVNEGQAAMIAGLNSQMSSMNSNFEKLVSEQRQANRLAV